MSEYDRMSNDELKCHAALLALEPGTFEDCVRQRWRDMYCKASDLMKTGLPHGLRLCSDRRMSWWTSLNSADSERVWNSAMRRAKAHDVDDVALRQ